MKFRSIAVSFALLCSPMLAWAQAGTLTLPSFQHLQARAIDSVDITIDSWPIRLASSFIEGDPDLKQLFGKLDRIQVRSYEFDADNVYSASDVDKVRKQLSGPQWSPLLQVRSAKENTTVDIRIAREGGKVSGLALVAAEPRKLTILNISGSVDPADIEKLQGRLGIPELGMHR